MVCFACRKPVTGRSVTAMGRVWHPEHFACARCLRAFPDSSFFEHQSKPDCQACYAAAFAPSCKTCERPIIGAPFYALNRYWHKEHFLCAYCSCPLAGLKFHEWEGRPLCGRCYGQLPSDVKESLRHATKR